MTPAAKHFFFTVCAGIAVAFAVSKLKEKGYIT